MKFVPGSICAGPLTLADGELKEEDELKGQLAHHRKSTGGILEPNTALLALRIKLAQLRSLVKLYRFRRGQLSASMHGRPRRTFGP